MDRNHQRTSYCLIIVLFSVSTLAESRFVYNRGSGNTGGTTTNSLNPSRTHNNNQARAYAVKPQQSVEVGVKPRPVAVTCHPNSMEVVVQADMFDTGLKVEGSHLRLGSGSIAEDSACRAVPSGEDEFTIWAHLMDCGTKLSSTKVKIIYSNVLVYSPEASSDGLLRLDGATIPVECHYEKKYAVDSIFLHPTWVPYVSSMSAEDQIDFNLRLMTDDWQFEKGSHLYFLGDPIHFEVSAITGNHMPLRVYVDHCVATATPDAEATLRYDFIEHYGCLTDAYQTNSSSRFLPRDAENKLRFQLDAFRFYKGPSNQVYITCYVRAVPVILAVGTRNRACSLIENRWQSVDGNDQACRSCEISHQDEEPPSTEPPTTAIITKALSTTASQESLVQNRDEQHPARFIRFRPGMQQKQHNKPHQSSAGLMRRETDETEKTVQLGPLIVVPSSKTVTRPTDAKVVLSPKNKTT